MAENCYGTGILKFDYRILSQDYIEVQHGLTPLWMIYTSQQMSCICSFKSFFTFAFFYVCGYRDPTVSWNLDMSPAGHSQLTHRIGSSLCKSVYVIHKLWNVL